MEWGTAPAVVVLKPKLGILPALRKRPLIVLVVGAAITEESHVFVAQGAEVRVLLLSFLDLCGDFGHQGIQHTTSKFERYRFSDLSYPATNYD